MKVLITGAAGFLGTHAAALCKERGYEVVGLDRSPPAAAHSTTFSGFVQSSVDARSLDSLLDRVTPDVCIHAAGMASVPASVSAPAQDFEQGVLPTLRLFDALRRRAPKCRTVFTSSAAVYGDPERLPVDEEAPPRPLSPYGFHKLTSELLCREFSSVYGLPTASVRIFSAYGEGLRRQVVWDVFEKAAAGGRVILQGSPAASRDFIHVRDVVEGILLVAERSPMGADTYNLASGDETPISHLAERICRATGNSAGVTYDDRLPAGTPLRWRADMSRIRDLGFVPRVSLDEGLARVHAWRREVNHDREH